MRKLLFVLLIPLLAACGQKVDQVKFLPPIVKADEQLTMAPPPPSADDTEQGLMTADPGVKSIEGDPTQTVKTNTVPPVSKKIIKEGEVTFETSDLKKARTALTDSLKKLGGYVDEENEENNADTERKEYTLKIRIPAQNFEKFLSAVSSSADRIESKSIRIKDVTTEFIDITTRLNNKKLLEDRYKALLAKAGKMADILEVENKLNEIRTDIETTQGQLNYLNKQIAYSSLQVTFFTRSADAKNEGNGFGYKFKLALANSWDLLQSIFFGLITAWPLILISVIVIIGMRKWLKRRKAKQV